MRVECFSVDDFLKCLSNENHIDGNTVRINLYERPLDKGVRDSIKYEIVLQASAIIDSPNGGQYLLEFGKNCGIDIRDADPDLSASKEAEEEKRRISEYAESRKLKVLPGIVHI